jgi:hypothetical protein
VLEVAKIDRGIVGYDWVGTVFGPVVASHLIINSPWIANAMA